MMTYGAIEMHIGPDHMNVRKGFNRDYGKLIALTVGMRYDYYSGRGYQRDWTGLRSLEFDLNPLENTCNYVVYNNGDLSSAGAIREWYSWDWKNDKHEYYPIPKSEIAEYVMNNGADSAESTLWIDPDRFKCTPFGINWSNLDYKTYPNIHAYFTDHSRIGYYYYAPRIENNKLFIDKVDYDELENYIDDDAR